MSKKMTIKEKTLLFIKKTKKKTDKQIVITIVVGITILLDYQYLFRSFDYEIDAARKPENKFIASFVGDIAFDENLYKVIKKEGNEKVIGNISEYFSVSDYVSGNLASQITNESANLLKKLNFTTVNLANDHEVYNDSKKLENKLKILEEFDIKGVGAGRNSKEAKEINYKDINGVRVATIGFTDVGIDGVDNYASKNKPGVLSSSPSNLMPLIGEAKSNSDLVIVHIHWGEKFATHINENQRDMAKSMSSAGADIIVGHNSNVLQTIEIFNDTVVFHDLGNFFSSQGYRDTKESTIAQYVINKDGSVYLELIPINIENGYPKLAFGMLNWLDRKNINLNLTRDLPDDVSWKIENDILKIKLK